MSQLIHLLILGKGLDLNPVCDYPVNTLLILVKKNNYNNEVLFLKYKRLISGRKVEYFT